MTDFDKIFEVIKTLDKEQFEVTTYGPYDDGTIFLGAYRVKDETEINFIFDEERKLTDIWVETYA